MLSRRRALKPKKTPGRCYARECLVRKSTNNNKTIFKINFRIVWQLRNVCVYNLNFKSQK